MRTIKQWWQDRKAKRARFDRVCSDLDEAIDRDYPRPAQ